MNDLQTNLFRTISFWAFFFCFPFLFGCQFEKDDSSAILIIGGGTSGISAGIAAARQGVSTVIVENTEWVGGMLTAAGVSAVDGNYNLPGGFWGEFRDSLINYYGHTDSLKTGWVSNVLFEPSIGDKILKTIASQEKELTILFKSRMQSIHRENEKWTVTIETPDGLKVLHPQIVIDATELGDVARQCGVPYDIGMENRDETGEAIAPEVSNHVIQDLTYVAILKDYGKDVTIVCPPNYNPEEFACACENGLYKKCDSSTVLWSKEKMIEYGKLPNNKYMINWPIFGNDFYLNCIEMSEKEREESLKAAKDRTIRFVYFIQKELGMNTLGLADDEFPTADRLPFIPYHRESLRIHGSVRFTLNHITQPYGQAEKLYRTSIAVGDYPVDHHHGRYFAPNKLPKLNFYPIPSFGVPLGVIIPQQIKNLIVAEKSISVSNLVNGTTRLQPVVMQIGQVSGLLAATAVKEKKNIEDVSIRTIQRILLSEGGYLLPFLDVKKEDPLFKPLQRIGVTGILQGAGKREGWENQTWIRAKDSLLWSELTGLKDVYPFIKIKIAPEPVTLQELVELIGGIAEKEKISVNEEYSFLAQKVLERYNFSFNPHEIVTRSEAALLIDQLLHPFEKEITIQGNFKN